MAANPIRRRLLKDIALAGGWEAVFERVASGENQTSIAKSFGVSQGFFSRVMGLDPDRSRLFHEAKRLAADVKADEAEALADGVPVERDAIAKVREQVAVRRWIAASWNRERYGEAKGGDVNVNVTVADVHLGALRHRMVEASRPLTALPAPAPRAIEATATVRDVPDPRPADVDPPPAAEEPPSAERALEGAVVWDEREPWCTDCDRGNCRHVKRETMRRAQAYADTHTPVPPRLRNLV